MFATLRRVALAQTLPRGESGPEAGDGSVAQTCSSVHPAGTHIGFGGVRVFQTEYWDQLPSLSSESKREDATARFLRRGFPYGFSRGIPCSAYTAKYPIPVARDPCAIDAYTVRGERDERTGEYREDEDGEDRDPLQ